MRQSSGVLTFGMVVLNAGFRLTCALDIEELEVLDQHVLPEFPAGPRCHLEEGSIHSLAVLYKIADPGVLVGPGYG